jgi:hypothetical protein
MTDKMTIQWRADLEAAERRIAELSRSLRNLERNAGHCPRAGEALFLSAQLAKQQISAALLNSRLAATPKPARA